MRCSSSHDSFWFILVPFFPFDPQKGPNDVITGVEVDEKFPDNTETGWKLGFYAASRASQLRRMRAPRPQVERGASVG